MAEKVDIVGPQGVIAEEPGVGITIAGGSTVPASASLGYAPSCLFVHNDATTDATRLYVNRGTKASANFLAQSQMLGNELRLTQISNESTDYMAIGGHDGDSAYIDVVGGSALHLKLNSIAVAVINTAQFAYTGILAGLTGIKTKQAVTNVHDTTPTASELTTAFGDPATLGRGFIGTVDDADGDTNGYIAWTSDASWYFLKGTKAS